ncbi:hypothetical protein ABPG74_018875 [Tetrahymena malaccensis]
MGIQHFTTNHTNFKASIQSYQFSQGQSSCNLCAIENQTFKGSDNILIEQVLQQPQKNLITNWSPLKGSSKLENFNQKIEGFNLSTMTKQISSFFTELKDEFIKKIDFCYKKNINQILELSVSKDRFSKITKKYYKLNNKSQFQSIAKITPFKNSKNNTSSIFISNISKKRKNPQKAKTSTSIM